MTIQLVFLKLLPSLQDNMFDEMQVIILSIMVLSEICYVCGDMSIYDKM